MATATRKRKPKGLPATKRHRRKVVATAPVASANKFAENQKPLQSMEDVNERIPELDEVCKSILADKAKRISLATDVEEKLGAVEKLLKDHNMDCVVVSGIKFYVEPSKSSVKMKKVKQ